MLTRKSRSTSRNSNNSRRTHSASNSRVRSKSRSLSRSNSQTRQSRASRSVSPNPIWNKIANAELAIHDATQALNKNPNHDTTYGWH